MNDGTGIEKLVDHRPESPMTRDQLIERLGEVGVKTLKAWDEFGPDAAPMLRVRYGRYVIVVGVEFAKEDDDD
jgi:hypothetical protein